MFTTLAAVASPLVPTYEGRILSGLGTAVMADVSVLLRTAWKGSQAAAMRRKPAEWCEVEPVVYEGWNGSVHTFWLSNANYCEWFCAANASKVAG